jgi:GNAT superfamily N-acetyltransferase
MIWVAHYLPGMSELQVTRVAPESALTIEHLREAALAEGHGFVERTGDEWESGANRFDHPGEALFLARIGDRVVGMCGLNIDPYLSDPRVGRIRHLYVLPDFRRQGVGRQLAEACLDQAANGFDRVRLRTVNPQAARFYSSVGFSEVAEDSATHSITLRN